MAFFLDLYKSKVDETGCFGAFLAKKEKNARKFLKTLDKLFFLILKRSSKSEVHDAAF